MFCRLPRQVKKTGVLSLLLAGVLWSPGAAFATGGNYVLAGGTPFEQQQVRDALAASSFNWSLVTQQITIHIDPSVTRDQTIPGEIFLDPDLLNSGELSWGVVQNEYASQVNFFLLADSQHAIFNAALGGTAWCYADQSGLQLAQYGCERFASTLAWAYWQSPENCIQPAYVGAVAAGMTPAAFRALLTSQLGTVTSVPSLTPPVSPAPTATNGSTPTYGPLTNSSKASSSQTTRSPQGSLIREARTTRPQKR